MYLKSECDFFGSPAVVKNPTKNLELDKIEAWVGSVGLDFVWAIPFNSCTPTTEGFSMNLPP